jgi:hypothetical protein
MSIQDLKTRLHDVPGIETLSMTTLGGRQIYVFDRRAVALDSAASDVEVIKPIREPCRFPACNRSVPRTFAAVQWI